MHTYEKVYTYVKVHTYVNVFTYPVTIVECKDTICTYYLLARSVFHVLTLFLAEQIKPFLGGSPGLVVMGGDSYSKGHGFESRRLILDGHDIFSH